jgi:putative membrane protein
MKGHASFARRFAMSRIWGLSEPSENEGVSSLPSQHGFWGMASLSQEVSMKRSLAILACTTLLATPVMAQSMDQKVQSIEQKAQSVGEKSGANSVLGITPSTADFVKEAATSDMLEIQISKLAQTNGNASEKMFADQMVADHTKTSSELKALVDGGKVSAQIPAALDSSSQSKLDKLKSKTGKDFSSDFDSMQVSAHKDAVSLFERYAKGGDNPALKDWATKTLPTLQQHLAMAQKLKP